MQKDSNSIYSAEERLAIYREARDRYCINPANPIAAELCRIVGNKGCYGMCQALNASIRQFEENHGRRFKLSILTKKNFPEYYSYKPKAGWNESNRFWWTLSIKNGGAKKRIEVFNRLAMGLSKGE